MFENDENKQKRPGLFHKNELVSDANHPKHLRLRIVQTVLPFAMGHCVAQKIDFFLFFAMQSVAHCELSANCV